MANFWHADVLDRGPSEIKTEANLFTLCSGLPADRTEAVTLDGFGGKRVASKAVSDTGNFALGAGSPSGRALTISGLSDISFESNATATHLAFMDDTRLLMAIQLGEPVVLPAGSNSRLIVTLSSIVLQFPLPQPHNLLTAIGAGGFSGASQIRIALDAGDITSYPGTGQSWLDLSGNGHDFFRGIGSGAANDDPTFNGTAGLRTSAEFFGFDGGDMFLYDLGGNEVWMNNLHKAGSAFTAVCVCYLSGFAIEPACFGTLGSGFGPGTRWDLTSAGKQTISIGNGTSFAMTRTASNAITDSAVHFLAVSIDEAAGAGGSFFYADGNYDVTASGNTFDGSFTSPSASDALYTLQVGAGGNNSGRLESGSRKLAFGMLPTAATKAQLDAIYRALKRW